MNQITAVGVVCVVVCLVMSCTVEALPFGFLASSAADQDYADADQLGSLRDTLIPLPASDYLSATPDKRSWRQGPNDECRTYAECRSRFVKYLDNLRKMGKVGR